jgi:ribosome-associated heat shock protein Hsp15
MMTAQTGERIDKYLWAVRLYKSRSAATDACRRGRVMVGGQPVKPAHTVSAGTTIIIRKPPVTYTYLVTALPPSRVGTKLVGEFMRDLTPEDEKNRIRPENRMINGFRPHGSGRPTKKERRELEDFLE